MVRYQSTRQLTLEGFAPFADKLDENNRWVVLGKALPWDELAGIYNGVLSPGKGRPAIDARRVIGAMIIKHKEGLDDRGTVEAIMENPYMQWFCGFSGFSTEPIFDASLMVTLRKRMGLEVFDRMCGSIIACAENKNPKVPPSAKRKDQKEDEGPVPPAHTPSNTGGKGVLKIDATVAPQKIAYPTDLNLLNEAREHTEALIDALSKHLALPVKPRTYRKLARKAYLLVIKKKKRTRGELRKALGKQLRYLRRNLKTIDGLWTRCGTPWPLKHAALRRYWVVQEVYRQQLHMHKENTRSVADRIVSLHQPWVRPIVRGKAAANTEFGAKLNVALCDGIAWVDHLDWNAHNESEWLMHHVERYKERFGHYPEAVNVDGIYGTRENRNKLKERGIRFIGKALGRPSAESLTPQAKRKLDKEMAQRNHIEGKFGQAKNAYGLDRIPAKLQATSESWIHATLLVINIFTLLPKLHERSDFFFGFLLRIVHNAMERIAANVQIVRSRVDLSLAC
jgi:transposase, IS5 family